jgi:hypothetical protein
MLKPVQKINLRKFIKRAAFITLILASLEVLIFVFLSSNNKSNISTNSEGGISKNHPTLSSAPEIDKISKRDTSQIIIPAISTLATDSLHNIDTGHTLINTVLADSNKLPNENVKGQQGAQTSLPIHLSNEKMLQLIKRIGAEKKRTHNKLNCVQVRKTSNSNVTNAFKIAELLKARGYIISGRIIIPGNQKGMKITTQSGCIQLTIGKL